MMGPGRIYKQLWNTISRSEILQEYLEGISYFKRLNHTLNSLSEGGFLEKFCFVILGCEKSF
jgi:hypothetical protein